MQSSMLFICYAVATSVILLLLDPVHTNCGDHVHCLYACRDLPVLGGGVWWPVKADPLAVLLEASDHRPVFMDVEVCAPSEASVNM
jgi:hypothetical protein